MNITIVGTGYVGLVTGVCLAHIGHNVTCLDINEDRIELLNRGIPPNYEPNLEELLSKNVKEGRLQFTTDYSIAFNVAEVIFIAVGTPMGKDGDVDLKDFYKVGVLIGQYINNNTVIAIKSTVPVGTNEILKKLISKTFHNKHFKISVVSNPEFLREGSAIEDTFEGDRIVIGTDDKWAASVMKRVFAPFRIPIVETDIRSAELIKYASNAFLATKISFINEIATLCEKIGANVDDVSKGMGMDSRIGDKFLNAGIGFGGSCFPKDLSALKIFAERAGHSFPLIDEVININNRQQKSLIKKAKERLGSLLGKQVAVIGLTFKPNTDDVRGAASIVMVNELLNDGAYVKVFDPVAIKQAKSFLRQEIEYAENIYEALTDVDMVFILTEWDEIKELDPKTFIERMKKPIIFDGRNCYSLAQMKKYNLEYHSIGRPVISNLEKKFLTISYH